MQKVPVKVNKKRKKIIKVRPTCIYPCQWDEKGEDKIIAYAERLMRPLKKYGNTEEGLINLGQKSNNLSRLGEVISSQPYVCDIILLNKAEGLILRPLEVHEVPSYA